MEILKSNQLLKHNAIWLVFIIEIIIFAIASHGTFVTGENLINIARQVSYYGIASIGMTFVILIAGIDLSIGSIITLVNVVCAFLMVNAGMNMWPAVLITLLMATAIGVINGGMVATIGIPALIATFASQTVFQGIAYLISGGRPIAGFSSDFGIFARWSIGPVPICAHIMVFCFALGNFILSKTYFGRYVYAIGGNEEAAVASGIAVKNIKLRAYLINGALVGVAAVLYMSRVNAGLPNGAQGAEFDALTTTIIGGTSFSGGIGTAGGTLIGAFIVGFLNNIMNLTSVNSYIQQIVKGAIIAVAVIYDIRSKRGGKKITRKIRGEQ